MRGVWIEIALIVNKEIDNKSLPMRGVWIEICQCRHKPAY